MSNQAQVANTVAAALTGERVTCAVSYAVIGDPEVDMMAGILAVIGAHAPTALVGAERISKVLAYLAGRYESLDRLAKDENERWRKSQQLGTYPPQWPANTAAPPSHPLCNVASMAAASQPDPNRYPMPLPELHRSLGLEE